MAEELQKDKIQRQAAQAPAGTGEAVWKPQHRLDCDGEHCKCPQVKAYESEADVIGYGGAAGGGKSDLALGFAGTKHTRSVIYRSVFPSLRGMIERSREIFNREGANHSKDSYNEQTHVWRLTDSKTIEFGAIQLEKDKKKKQGQPHDFICFDEATEFPESIVRFLMAWCRTTIKGQKCRVLLPFNPPMDQTQEWIISFFAPWIDEKYPDPALDGEIRYVVRHEDKDTFYRTLEDIPEEIKERLKAAAVRAKVESWEQLIKTRTFFHASLSDNPIQMETGYAAQIESLPDELRLILQGNFNLNKIENPWQVIPTAWVKAAIERGKQRERRTEKQTALGVDVARGGKDKFTIAPLYGLWFDDVIKYPGTMVTSGPDGTALIVNAQKDESVVGIDLIGIGTSVYDSAIQLNVNAIAFNGSEGTGLTDKSGRLHFRNVRSASHWLFREALDPDNGSEICLPDDPEMLGDLTAARFTVVAGRVIVESKDDDSEKKIRGIRSRLGRSPDVGDAIVIAWYTSTVAGGPLYYE